VFSEKRLDLLDDKGVDFLEEGKETVKSLQMLENNCFATEAGSTQRGKVGKEKCAAPIPRVFAYEWQGKDLRDTECARVANKRLAERCFCVLAHDGTPVGRLEIAGRVARTIPGGGIAGGASQMAL
jgi:hypothetical protein